MTLVIDRLSKDRMLVYYLFLRKAKDENKMCKNEKKKTRLDEIIEKESQFERKIYYFLKIWEKRHPLLAITLCTMLGVILLNLLTGIMEEAVIMTFLK